MIWFSGKTGNILLTWHSVNLLWYFICDFKCGGNSSFSCHGIKMHNTVITKVVKITDKTFSLKNKQNDLIILNSLYIRQFCTDACWVMVKVLYKNTFLSFWQGKRGKPGQQLTDSTVAMRRKHNEKQELPQRLAVLLIIKSLVQILAFTDISEFVSPCIVT